MMTGFGMNGFMNIDGGNTVNRDPNAAREISSKKIKTLECHFFAYNWLLNPPYESFHINVDNDDTGKLILRGVGAPIETDESFLEKIQEVIDKNNLVAAYNGVVENAQGLPAEFQSYWIDARYDSGERLFFSVRGNPSFPWCLDIRKALCNELLRHGDESLLSPKADRNVVRFDLEIHKWPWNLQYFTFRHFDDPEGSSKYYMRTVWNKITHESVSNEEIIAPDGFYQMISEMIDKTPLRDLVNGRIDFEDGVKSDEVAEPVIHFCVQGESGRQFNHFETGDNIESELFNIADSIREYIDTVFEENGKTPRQKFNDELARLNDEYKDTLTAR